MATLAELRTAVARKTGLTDEVGNDERTALTAWANEAVIDFLRKVHSYVATATVSLVAGTSDYQLSQSNLVVLGGYIVGTDYNTRFEPVSFQEILDLRLNSVVSTTVTLYCLAGANLLLLYPTPAAAATLNLYVVPKPTAMSSDSHDPSTTTYGGIPVEDHPALEAYMSWKAYEKQGGPQSGEAQVAKQVYDNYVSQGRAYQLGRRGKLPRGTLAQGRAVPKPNPSVYP